MSRLNEFREFVNKYPDLINQVNSNSTSWQKIYEQWVLFGEESFKSKDKAKLSNMKDIIKRFENIDTEKLNNTLNSVQKIMQIVSQFSPTKQIQNLGGYLDWWN